MKENMYGHVDLGRKRLLSDEEDVETLANCLFEWISKILEKDQAIINLATGLRKISYILDIILALQSSA